MKMAIFKMLYLFENPSCHSEDKPINTIREVLAELATLSASARIYLNYVDGPSLVAVVRKGSLYGVYDGHIPIDEISNLYEALNSHRPFSVMFTEGQILTATLSVWTDPTLSLKRFQVTNEDDAV